MPLPESTASTPWPPPDIKPYVDDQRAWGAWWSGDPQRLATTTHGGGTTQRRTFWGRQRPTDGGAKATAQLHATLAADIASTSADLLFGEPPNLLVPDVGLARAHERRATNPSADVGDLGPWPDTAGLTTSEVVAAQDRLDDLADTLGLANSLLEGAELCAATGGVYLRPMWDKNAADHPLLTTVDPDLAVPDFRYGRLVAVTFVEEVLREGAGDSVVWRHLERHEPGVILHGLYVGTGSTLGRQAPLTDHPTTRGLMPEVRVPVEATGGRPGIMPRFVPNVLPNRRRRRYPIGRSDYAGCESFLDALDETWTSWMRDLRLGQARLLVPDEFLRPIGARGRIPEGQKLSAEGMAMGFDLDDELLTGLNMADLTDLKDPITQVQFDIRVEQHEKTALALTEQIISTAGYSPQSFGLRIEGRAESGTALRIREAKTWRTQGRKQRYWAPELSSVLESLLALDRVVFGRPTPIVRPAIGWQELADDPQGTAQWVNTLAAAQAASIETRVRLAQPGLDDDQVAAEVQRIKDESGTALPDPTPGLELP